eukprot:m.66887 g.66887  ORF g.66887 m.66887 type:complete len:211 (-) comp13613_c2_seq2:577-1209(-)
MQSNARGQRPAMITLILPYNNNSNSNSVSSGYLIAGQDSRIDEEADKFETDCDDEDVSTLTQQARNRQDVEARFVTAIQENVSIYSDVLLMRPIPLAHFTTLAKQNGIKLKASEVMSLCDKHGITFTAPRRAPRQRSATRPRGTASIYSSITTACAEKGSHDSNSTHSRTKQTKRATKGRAARGGKENSPAIGTAHDNSKAQSKRAKTNT